MDEADQFESVGLDDSVEDERDFDQIMEDRRAAEIELDNRDGRASNRSKLPQLLHDQGNHFIFSLHFNFFIINCLITS
jgi:DNA replication licensing factor MCM2